MWPGIAGASSLAVKTNNNKSVLTTRWRWETKLILFYQGTLLNSLLGTCFLPNTVHEVYVYHVSCLGLTLSCLALLGLNVEAHVVNFSLLLSQRTLQDR